MPTKEDLELMEDFQIVDKPIESLFMKQSYSIFPRIAIALKNLSNDKAICLEKSEFPKKNLSEAGYLKFLRANINNAGRRLKIKSTCVRRGTKYYFFTRNGS